MSLIHIISQLNFLTLPPEFKAPLKWKGPLKLEGPFKNLKM